MKKILAFLLCALALFGTTSALTSCGSQVNSGGNAQVED